MNKLTLGFSPCPNDTFIFDALVNGGIDTQGITFDVHVADVEELNRLAFAEELDITKLSYHALGHLTRPYQLLNAGSALGRNCGPLLIARDPNTSITPETRIAIPGKYTTANFLLSLAYPHALSKFEVLFSKIEQAVLDKEFDAGVIIHENRFTYQNKGLHKLRDLGEYWEEETQLPIPLGGIVIKRELSEEVKRNVDQLIRKSVEFAFANPLVSLPYVEEHAQEMEEGVVKQHIALYVNEYSKDLGRVGRNAVINLFEKAQELGIIPPAETPIFVS